MHGEEEGRGARRLRDQDERKTLQACESRIAYASVESEWRVLENVDTCVLNDWSCMSMS